MKRVWLIACLSLAALNSHAAPSPVTRHSSLLDSDAIRALIGEVGDQSPHTYLMVASAIRNRGSLQGIYGLHNAVVNQAPAKLWARAKAAWESSAHVRLTRAKYFGCPTDADYFLHALSYHPIGHAGNITFYQP